MEAATPWYFFHGRESLLDHLLFDPVEKLPLAYAAPALPKLKSHPVLARVQHHGLEH